MNKIRDSNITLDMGCTGYMQMDKGDLNELRLMGEIERDGDASQRELAHRLNLSLGLTNAFLKRLVSKGYFKVTHLPRNRVKYLLTPSGIAHKSRLTVQYLRYSVNFYREIKTLLTDTYNRLQRKGVRTVLFFGSGEIAELAYLYLKTTELELAGIVDENLEGRPFFEFQVRGAEGLSDLKWDAVIVTRLDAAAGDFELLTRFGVDRGRIVTL